MSNPVLYRRDAARKRLNNLLSMAPAEDFVRLVWAVDILQGGGNPTLAARHISFPPEAATREITSTYRAHPWKQETLINELLTSPKRAAGKLRSRTLDCSTFDALAMVTNVLNDLEDAEDGIWLRTNSVLDGMQHLGHRQFPWQRGFVNITEFYRNARIYHFAETEDYFSGSAGVSLSQFSKTAFALFAHFSHFPVARNLDLSQVGISKVERDATLRLVSAPIDVLKGQARAMREGQMRTAYKPSVIRGTPCIEFPGQRVYCPIRDLLVKRATSGIYYDLIAGGETIKNRIGANFENYCIELAKELLSTIEAAPQFQYRNGQMRTPDILLMLNGEVVAAVECKATKLTLAAQFDDKPLEKASIGYDDIVKGIFQVWRFRSHARRRLLGRPLTISADFIGVVLTLDDWLLMNKGVHAELRRRAEIMAAEREPEMVEEDRVAIAFCSIRDFETLLTDSSDELFLATLRRASEEDRLGYFLHSVRDEVGPGEPRKDYPFVDRIADVLPWWSDMDEHRSR